MTGELRAIPAARAEELVTTETTHDLLVYDQRTHHLHCLNTTAVTVWQLCDGERTVDDIATMAGSSEEIVRLALTKLDEAKLLVTALPAVPRVTGQSRRMLLRRAGIAGALALPAIVSVTAPTAAEGGSNQCGRDCTFGGSPACVLAGGPCIRCDLLNNEPPYIFICVPPG